MPLQHGCRMIGADRTLDGISYRNRLAGIRHAQDDALALQDLADAHGDGVVRNGRKGREPPFAELLPPAGFVERDNDIGVLGVEIGWRIVEGEMAVLADSGKAHRYALPCDEACSAATSPPRSAASPSMATKSPSAGTRATKRSLR